MAIAGINADSHVGDGLSCFLQDFLLTFPLVIPDYLLLFTSSASSSRTVDLYGVSIAVLTKLSGTTFIG